MLLFLYLVSSILILVPFLWTWLSVIFPLSLLQHIIVLLGGKSMLTGSSKPVNSASRLSDSSSSNSEDSSSDSSSSGSSEESSDEESETG